MTESLDEFHARARAHWRAQAEAVIGPFRPARAEWTDINDIVAVVTHFLGSEWGHTYFPDGGGQSMKRVSLGREPGTIELAESDQAVYVFKVERASVNYIAAAPGQSFLYLHCGELADSGTYERPPLTGFEELVEIDGNYHERVVWDQGYVRHDENGDEVPLPDDARLVLRSRRGNVLFVGNGSLWNAGETYDGEHDKFGEEGVRRIIEREVSKRELTE